MKHTIVEYADKEWLIPFKDEPMTHDEAIKFVEELGDEWRLPLMAEVMPLIINEKALKQTQKALGKNWVWLADKFSASRAWTVSFVNGSCGSNHIDYTYGCVRAVRSGQSSR